MLQFLEEATRRCGRIVKESEFTRAINNSARSLAEGVLAKPRQPKWPARNPAKVTELMQTPVTCAALREQSPVKWSDEQPHTEEIINRLFSKDSLLCVGKSAFQCTTAPRERLRGVLNRMQFIVPSPMSKLKGLTQEGKVSRRSLDNTGPRRYLVIEFDQGPLDQQATILAHLARYLRLILVVHSGSKSLHGWFAVAGLPETEVQKFFAYAVSLGADPALWNRCQLCRMPDGLRDNGNRQSVLYFNPVENK